MILKEFLFLDKVISVGDESNIFYTGNEGKSLIDFVYPY